MKIEFLKDDEKNELIINLYYKDKNLLKTERLSADFFKGFDLGKILKFLKKLQAIINKLLEIYCKG